MRHELRFKPVRKLKLSPYTSAIEQGLFEAANNPSGTSFAVFNGFTPPVAGKTGTAAGARRPIPTTTRGTRRWRRTTTRSSSSSSMIEHGGFGANAAAPAAKQIYQAYFNSH